VTPGDAAATTLKPTKRQTQKLGVLVGTLRDSAEAITTEQLWSALAKARGVDVQVMIELLGGMVEVKPVLSAGDDGDISNLGPTHRLSFGPLLDDLNRAEASDLIDRLERLEANLPKAAA